MTVRTTCNKTYPKKGHSVLIKEGIQQKDIISWNTMSAGYARHGFGRQALPVFDSMKIAGFIPDEITMENSVRNTP